MTASLDTPKPVSQASPQMPPEKPAWPEYDNDSTSWPTEEPIAWPTQDAPEWPTEEPAVWPTEDSDPTPVSYAWPDAQDNLRAETGTSKKNILSRARALRDRILGSRAVAFANVPIGYAHTKLREFSEKLSEPKASGEGRKLNKYGAALIVGATAVAGLIAVRLIGGDTYRGDAATGLDQYGFGQGTGGAAPVVETATPVSDPQNVPNKPAQPLPSPVAPMDKPVSVEMPTNSSIWNLSREHLQRSGFEATNQQIADLKNHMLENNGISEQSAQSLPAGQKVRLPGATALKQIIER